MNTISIIRKHNIRERKGKTYQKLKRSPEERHTQIHGNFFRNISMVTDFFPNQKRVNVCEHMTKMESQESF